MQPATHATHDAKMTTSLVSTTMPNPIKVKTHKAVLPTKSTKAKSASPWTQYRSFAMSGVSPPSAAYFICESSSSFVLNFFKAFRSVSMASTGFRSTIMRRSLRMASRCFTGKSFSSLRVPDFGMSMAG